MLFETRCFVRDIMYILNRRAYLFSHRVDIGAFQTHHWNNLDCGNWWNPFFSTAWK